MKNGSSNFYCRQRPGKKRSAIFGWWFKRADLHRTALSFFALLCAVPVE